MTIAAGIAAEMKKTNDVFAAQVVQHKDLNALDQVYTANARILPPGTEMITGRENIRSFWRAAIDAMGIDAAKLTIVDAEQAGDSIVEIGRAELAFTNGQTAIVKYVVHWKQEDGRWKWHVDIWNLNQ